MWTLTHCISVTFASPNKNPLALPRNVKQFSFVLVKTIQSRADGSSLPQTRGEKNSELNEFFNKKWVAADFGNAGLPVPFNTIMLCHLLPRFSCLCQMLPGHSGHYFPSSPHPHLSVSEFSCVTAAADTRRRWRPAPVAGEKRVSAAVIYFFTRPPFNSPERKRLKIHDVKSQPVDKLLAACRQSSYKRMGELCASSLWYISFSKGENDMSLSDWTLIWLEIFLFFF